MNFFNAAGDIAVLKTAASLLLFTTQSEYNIYEPDVYSYLWRRQSPQQQVYAPYHTDSVSVQYD